MAAVIAAAGVLGAGRLGYGLLAERYARAFESVPIARGSLAALPEDLLQWRGRDEPLDDLIARATDTDDHVNRSYRHVVSGQSISLFIGYGGRFRDLMPHRPEVCYPGAGYTLESREARAIPIAGGGTLACQVLRFSRGVLQAQRIRVLSYYLVDGAYCPDVSLLRSRAARLSAGGRYMAQVQIVSSDDARGPSGAHAVEAFASDSAAAIRETIEAAVNRARSTAPAASAGEVARGAG